MSKAIHDLQSAHLGKGGGLFARYRELNYGNATLLEVLRIEVVMLFVNGLPGALGLWLRSKLYPALFARVGRRVFFGRNLVLRNPRKIRVGDGVIIDDNVVLDAKGTSNQGIRIGNNVFIGRNTIVSCKDGDIVIEGQANLSSNCQVFSAGSLTVGEGTVMGAFSHVLSGGEYDYSSLVPFSHQTGLPFQGPTIIGRNCWIGAHVVVVDGASVGDHCVIGAGAVVTRSIPAESIAVGVPAKVIGKLKVEA